jgi:ketosteroid isomerase-like protein
MHPEQHPILGADYGGTVTTPVTALEQFYAAFNSGDLDLMAANWDQSEEAAMDNPLGGIARGWEAISALYEKLFRGPVRIHVELYDYTFHESPELFYVVGRERGVLERDGRQLVLAIRTTRVYRRLAGVWRQVHHHGSMDDPALLKQYQDMVLAT